MSKTSEDRERRWRREYTREKRQRRELQDERRRRERRRERRWRREYNEEQAEKRKLKRYQIRRAERASISGARPKSVLYLIVILSSLITLVSIAQIPKLAPFAVFISLVGFFVYAVIALAIRTWWQGRNVSSEDDQLPIAQTPQPFLKSTDTLSPREFEQEVAWVFEHLYPKLKAEIVGGRGDGGIDVKLYDPSGMLYAIIQAKRYNSRKALSPSFLRDLDSNRRRLGVRRAVLVTTARFSQETYYQARQMRIDLVDGEQFHQMRLKAHTPPISPALEPPHSEVPPSISEPDAVIRQLQDRMLKLNDPFLDDQKDDNWQLDSGHREP